MIKLFSKIRQRLLTENKFSKYLLYAIGEIVLVVIGILIALSINNWNTDQADRAEEQLLLQNLKHEFTQNLNQLHADHAINLSTLEETLNYLETRGEYKKPEQIDHSIGRFCTFATFDPSVGYIEQAISSGKLDLIQSDSLKIYLSQWSGELNDLKEDVIIRRDHWLHHLSPIVRKYLPMRNTDMTQDRPDYQRQNKIEPIKVSEENYKEFAASVEVDGVIYDHYMNQSYVVINEEHIEVYIKRVLDLIHAEIKQLN